MDEIKIVDLEVYANHGVFAEENALGQKFLVSVTLYTDTHKAGTSDRLEDSVDYASICHLVDKRMRNNTYKLIERAAETIAQEILKTYKSIIRVIVEIKKPWAPIGLPVSYASVKIVRDRSALTENEAEE